MVEYKLTACLLLLGDSVLVIRLNMHCQSDIEFPANFCVGGVVVWPISTQSVVIRFN